MSESIGQFVDLLNFEQDYEILNEYPYTIRRKRDLHEVKESLGGVGYIRVHLNGGDYYKHRLIAKQFIPNPENLPFVDHVNHDRTDYHIENLRWCSCSKNNRNRTSFRGIQYEYVDIIPDDAIIVDYYETKNGRHEFEDYYYHDGKFYYDNDINYRVLHVNVVRSGTECVRMRDIYGVKVSVCIKKFLQQHDML